MLRSTREDHAEVANQVYDAYSRAQEVRALAINEVSIRREKYQAAKLKIEIDGVTRMEELVNDKNAFIEDCIKTTKE